MASRARNALLGIAGGVQGYLQAAQMERQEEEHRLKQKLVDLQVQGLQDKLIDSGLKRERQSQLRLALKQKVASGEQIKPEEFLQFLDEDETGKFLLELAKEARAREAEANKIQFAPAGSGIIQGGRLLGIMPQKETTPKIGTDREAIRMELTEQLGREPTMAEVNRLHQTRSVETAGQKFNITIPGREQLLEFSQGVKPVEGQAQTALANITEFEGILNEITKNFKPDYLGPIRNLPLVPGTRRRIGMISPQESEFLRSLKDLQDLKLRIRSGAQTAEPEFRRLVQSLPEPTDVDPLTFISALNRVKRSVQAQKEARIKLATTPRKELKKPSGGGQILQFNPATGLIE